MSIVIASTRGAGQIWENAYQHECSLGFPGGSVGKESACNVGDPGSNTGLETIPWRKEWQPTPVFLPGEFHGQRSVVAYNVWVAKSVA